MNSTIAKSYFRSVLRGTRTIEQVPPQLRGAVEALLRAGKEGQ